MEQQLILFSLLVPQMSSWVFNPAGSGVLERPAGALRAGKIVTIDLRAANYVTLCLHPCEHLSTDSRSCFQNFPRCFAF
jgi:hypothetical protein